MSIAKASFNIEQDIAAIKAKLKPQSYATCGHCGAVKVEAIELARGLNLLDEDDWWAIAFDLSRAITERTPMKLDNEAFRKWYDAHEKSICNFDDPDECEFYVKYSEVVLYDDPCCPCFDKGTIPSVV